MRPTTRTAKPARPARRGRPRASVSRTVRLPLPFLALCGLLLLLFALAEFVRPPAAPPQAATVAQTAKSADGNADPTSTSNLNLNGDVSPGNTAAGVRIQKKEIENVSTETAGSLIGSVNGAVDLYAGRDATIIGSELWSQNGLSIDAETINILAGKNQTTSTYKETFFQSGVTVAFKSTVTDMAMGLYQTAKRGTEVKDDRLKGLYAAKTAYAAMDLYKGLQNANTDKGSQEQAASVKISISFGANYSENTQTYQITDFVGSSLTTAGDMTLIARGDQSGSGVPPLGSGNIAIVGSDLFANNLTLDAKNNITIQSAVNTHEMDSDNWNAGGAVGISVGVGSGASGISFFADVSAGKGFEEGNGSTQLNSHLAATENLTIKSGNDTTIAGATASGDKVTMEVGGDLTLESRQDTDDYKSKQQQISAGGSGGVGGGEGHMSYSESKTESSYASVVEQTGIYAGEGGFDINVGGNTSLTGAVIASEADASQNRLSTETISFTDIQNHSEYDSKSLSISVSAGSGGGSISGGMSHQSDSKTGTTYSAIADGDITVRSDFDAAGNRIADSLAGLSSDTAHANDGSLGNIFDREKLAEQQEIAQVAGEVGFRAAGDIGKIFSKEAEIKEAQARQLEKDASNPDITPERRAELQAEANALHAEAAPVLGIWGEGGIAKIAMHTAVGAAQASLGGADVLSGALGAGAAETVRGIDLPEVHTGNKKLDNALNQTLNTLASTAAGAVAGGLAGDAMTGAGAALDAEKYNRALHPSELAKIKELAQQSAAENGLPLEEAERQLLAVAMAMVDAGAETGNATLMARNAEVLADATSGGDYAWAYNVLTGEKSMAQTSWSDSTLFSSLVDGSPSVGISLFPSQGNPHYFLEYGEGWERSDTLMGEASKSQNILLNPDAFVQFSNETNLATRMEGLVQLSWGSVGAVGSSATIVGTVGTGAGVGWLGLGLSSDQMSAGLIKIFTGNEQQTLINYGLTDGLGLSPQQAYYAETGLNLATAGGEIYALSKAQGLTPYILGNGPAAPTGSVTAAASGGVARAEAVTANQAGKTLLPEPPAGNVSKQMDFLDELFSNPSIDKKVVAETPNIEPGRGVTVEIDGHKIYDPNYPPLSTNPNQTYRFSDPTTRATGGDVYFGENVVTSYFEVRQNVSGKALYVGEINIGNVLDLTDPATLKAMNIDYNKLTAPMNATTPAGKNAVYNYTNEIANQAYDAGYSGIIYPSSRNPNGGRAVVLFDGKYDPNAITPILNTKIPTETPPSSNP